MNWPRKVKMSPYMTFGDSHTDNYDLPKKYRWMHLVNKNTGIKFSKYGQCGSGLLNIISYITHDYNASDASKVKCVVLQKSQSFRFPWWDGYDFRNHFNRINKRYKKIGWKWLPKRTIYWQAKRHFSMLSGAKKEDVSQKLFEVDIEMIKYFISLFPNAKFAYYHYWIDNLIMKVSFSNLYENNIKLGEVAESLGMSNWGIIIDPYCIPGMMEQGNPVFDKKKLFESGYTYSARDTHPSAKYQRVVAHRAAQWLKEEGEIEQTCV